eukprot:1161222-Pelagomonas_calceolata.AAC.3
MGQAGNGAHATHAQFCSNSKVTKSPQKWTKAASETCREPGVCRYHFCGQRPKCSRAASLPTGRANDERDQATLSVAT